MKILSAASSALGQRVQFGEGQRLELYDKRSSKDPLTPVNLVTLMTSVLLEAKPFLVLLSEYLESAPGDEAANDDTPG